MFVNKGLFFFSVFTIYFSKWKWKLFERSGLPYYTRNVTWHLFPHTCHRLFNISLNSKKKRFLNDWNVLRRLTKFPCRVICISWMCFSMISRAWLARCFIQCLIINKMMPNIKLCQPIKSLSFRNPVHRTSSKLAHPLSWTVLLRYVITIRGIFFLCIFKQQSEV